MITLSWLSSRRYGVQIPVPPHQSLEPKHPYTPPPGRKDVSRVPKGMVYAKAEHPGCQKNKPVSCSPEPAWHGLHRPDDARHDEVGVEDAEGDLGGILDMREKFEKKV